MKTFYSSIAVLTLMLSIGCTNNEGDEKDLDVITPNEDNSLAPPTTQVDSIQTISVD